MISVYERWLIVIYRYTSVVEEKQTLFNIKLRTKITINNMLTHSHSQHTHTHTQPSAFDESG